MGYPRLSSTWAVREGSLVATAVLAQMARPGVSEERVSNLSAVLVFVKRDTVEVIQILKSDLAFYSLFLCLQLL